MEIILSVKYYKGVLYFYKCIKIHGLVIADKYPPLP